MKQLACVLSIALGLGLLSSCDEGVGQKRGVLQPMTGVAGEIIVVMDEDLWNDAPGDTVRALLQAPYPMILQGEPLFKVFFRSSTQFNAMDRSHRNIILCDIRNDSANAIPKAVQNKSRWSQGQKVFTFKAQTPEEFYALWRKYGPAIAEDIEVLDRERIMDYIYKNRNAKAQGQLKEKMGLEVTMYSDFRPKMSRKTVSSYLRERMKHVSGGGYGFEGASHDIMQGLLVYTYPYTSDTLLTPENLTRKRNEIAGKYIKSAKDSPMITEPRLAPKYIVTEHNGSYAIESRGLWKFKNPISGGNFISLTVIDEELGRIVTVDGYAFAPNFDKRPIVQDLEALVYSLDLTGYRPE